MGIRGFAVYMLPVWLAGSALPARAGDCKGLARISLAATAISTAAVVPAGSFTPEGSRELRNLPEFCRVGGVIKPSSDSEIRFEVWLPAAGWSGKFQGIGNGGFAGSISYGGLAEAIRHGYAAASTDTGHRGEGTNAEWALNHPERIADFGHRAIHEMTAKAKAIAAAYYGSAAKRSYFSSCSNGGRQALMEAQRYPGDYDGIIAGAPANNWTALLVNAMAMTQAATGDAYIPASKLRAIQDAALAACDFHDTVKDALIEDPARCRVDPGRLLCGGTETDNCLTAPQVNALRKIYGGTRSAKGALVSAGYAPGGEAEQGGWGPWITGDAPEKSLMYIFGSNYFRNMVYSNPAWDYRTFQVDRDLQAALKKTAHLLNATDPDLRRFQARGGKLILYHGWSDAAIPAQHVIDYYESVQKRLGATQTASFVRLYMVPGMQHCGGGSGPNVFGQASVGAGDPGSNIAAALERWVEQGVAPNEIVATKYKTGSNPASGVARTRPLCPYPKVARYKGTGSIDEAANFACVVPQRGP
jgi:feruloyl esterase